MTNADMHYDPKTGLYTGMAYGERITAKNPEDYDRIRLQAYRRSKQREALQRMGKLPRRSRIGAVGSAPRAA